MQQSKNKQNQKNIQQQGNRNRRRGSKNNKGKNRNQHQKARQEMRKANRKVKVDTSHVQMTKEFRRGLDLISQGRSVLISGSAGTGKSTFIEMVKNSGAIDLSSTLIVAPTGTAAVNIGGTTIHKAFSLYPGTYYYQVAEGTHKVAKDKFRVLKAVKTLIIDEISMVRSDLLDMVDVILKRAKRNSRPFGGVQVILVGDMLQLPPIVQSAEKRMLKQHWGSPYFTSSKAYKKAKITQVNLTKPFRQNEQEFLDLLHMVRNGTIDQAHIDKLNKLCYDPDFTPDNNSVTLAAKRNTVERINNQGLRKLGQKVYEEKATYEGTAKANMFVGSDTLRFSLGARVMLIYNDPEGAFVNGSLGTIIAYKQEYYEGLKNTEVYKKHTSKVESQLEAKAKLDANTSPTIVSILLDNGSIVDVNKHTWEVKQPYEANGKIASKTVGTIRQYPFILAWSMTVHKAQGKSIDNLHIELTGGMFAEGQFYVALSRGTNLKGITFSQPVTKRMIKVDPDLVEKFGNL